MGFEIEFFKENFNVSLEDNELFEKWNITIFEMNNSYNSSTIEYFTVVLYKGLLIKYIILKQSGDKFVGVQCHYNKMINCVYEYLLCSCKCKCLVFILYDY